jgi:hypothetical protein
MADIGVVTKWFISQNTKQWIAASHFVTSEALQFLLAVHVKG